MVKIRHMFVLCRLQFTEALELKHVQLSKWLSLEALTIVYLEVWTIKLGKTGII